MNNLIRPESDLDRAAIRDVNQRAFGGNSEADLVDALRDGGYCRISLVAIVDEVLIGHILFSPLTVITENETTSALSLAPMAVDPSYQRKGVGTRLVEVGLNACRETGCNLVFVLGYPAFYSRFGFSSKLARRVESPFGGDDAWMALELVPGALNRIHGRAEFSPPFRMFE